MDLKAQRAELAKAEYNSYDPENFPGSKGWLKNKQARRALDEFDSAHPEIIAANKADREKKEEAAYEGMSDFAKWGS